MIRALSILAAIVALAVSAAPALAGGSKKPPPRAAAVVVLIGANDYGLMETDGDKLFLRGKAKAPRLTSISDGTSNTMMRSGSLKPPKGRILDAHFEI